MKPDKEIARLKRQLDTERSENTRLQERLRAKDNELDTAEARIVEFKKSESTAQSEILFAKQRIGVLESLVSTTSEELLGTLAKAEKENSDLAGSLKHANDRIKTLIEDRDPIREARDMFKTKLSHMSQNSDARSAEHREMKDALNRMCEKYKELQYEKLCLEVRVETQNSIKDKLDDEKAKDGALPFKDPTSGQLMTSEQLFELHQKSVQDHKTLEQKYNRSIKLYGDLIVSNSKRKRQDTEQYNALEEKYNEAKEKADKAEKDMGEAVRGHCRAMCAMKEEKDAEIQRKNDRIEALTTGINQIGTISFQLGKGSPGGPDRM
ncbi:hypothetical protein G7Y79_00023g053610 [Physcia stellaris]|nr:hypothetical protein G7Y79_00023g053610 [Physcia stellaris]